MLCFLKGKPVFHRSGPWFLSSGLDNSPAWMMAYLPWFKKIIKLFSLLTVVRHLNEIRWQVSAFTCWLLECRPVALSWQAASGALFLLLLLLRFSWFTMFCWFQVYCKVIQLYIYSFFFRLFFHIGYHRVLSRVLCMIL